MLSLSALAHAELLWLNSIPRQSQDERFFYNATTVNFQHV